MGRKEGKRREDKSLFLSLFIFSSSFCCNCLLSLSLLPPTGQLTVRKQTVKLNMYKKFFIGLVVSAFASGFMMFYQLLVIFLFFPSLLLPPSLSLLFLSSPSSLSSFRWVAAGFVDDEAKWATSWVWLVFWNIVYFILLLLVAILWRPQVPFLFSFLFFFLFFPFLLINLI